jgi:hypothetical protein
MSILLPYAREAVSDITTRGGFPPLLLAPVNFDALYQQHLKEQQDQAAESLTEDDLAQAEVTLEAQTHKEQASADDAVKH